MSRITPLAHADAEGKSRELLDAVKASLGVTPNMTTTMARSSVLAGWLGLSGALGAGPIRGADGERIALGVSESNGCGYCLSAHTYLGTNVAKLDAEEIELARQFRSSKAKSAAILAFADAVLEGKGRISEKVIETARAAGLSDSELGDIVGHVAVNVLTNYFNNAFEVDIDFPVVTPNQPATV